MHEFHRQTGFTLLEVVIVVVIAGVLSAMAAPMVLRYRLVEDARAQANMVARAITEARSQAMAAGNPTFLLFDNPNNAVAAIPAADGRPRFALLVDDLDGNGQLTAGENTRNFHAKDGLSTQVTGYGQGGTQPFGNAPLPLEDATAGQLQDLGNTASTFALDPTTNVPAIGFNSQGVPVALATPTQWGTGAGAYYVTDNDRTVYAVIVLPLGGLRVRVLSPQEGNWH